GRTACGRTPDPLSPASTSAFSAPCFSVLSISRSLARSLTLWRLCHSRCRSRAFAPSSFLPLPQTHLPPSAGAFRESSGPAAASLPAPFSASLSSAGNSRGVQWAKSGRCWFSAAPTRTRWTGRGRLRASPSARPRRETRPRDPPARPLFICGPDCLPTAPGAPGGNGATRA
ncbi:MAG: hypothetical protein BJ554DRAFT_1713, partial [Olpidium bornovanus]